MRHGICSVLVAGALALGSLFAIAPMAVAAEASVSHCVAPADLTRLDLPLRRTARHLASRKLTMIVALGSSSTAGAGASSAETTYPSWLMVELAQRFQTQPIMVLNRGISGERAIDMLARFDESVAAEHPDLVLWQVGTNAVLIRKTKAIGADLVLIDPQFAPKVIAKPEIEEMVDLISSAAAQEKVDVFHRFALMRHWHDIDGMPSKHFFRRTGCI
jgi:acyl-CoA thioesterase I